MGIVKDKIKDLKEREARILEMGGEKLVAKHKEKGKLTARERLACCSTRAPSGKSTCS